MHSYHISHTILKTTTFKHTVAQTITITYCKVCKWMWRDLFCVYYNSIQQWEIKEKKIARWKTIYLTYVCVFDCMNKKWEKVYKSAKMLSLSLCAIVKMIGMIFNLRINCPYILTYNKDSMMISDIFPIPELSIGKLNEFSFSFSFFKVLLSKFEEIFALELFSRYLTLRFLLKSFRQSMKLPIQLNLLSLPFYSLKNHNENIIHQKDSIA